MQSVDDELSVEQRHLISGRVSRLRYISRQRQVRSHKGVIERADVQPPQPSKPATGPAGLQVDAPFLTGCTP